MQLGNILSTASDPVVGRVVKFRVLGTDAAGKQVSAQAEAVLAFVSEEAREESKKLARDWLERGDYKDAPIPSDVLIDEEYRWFAMASLRDKDNPARQFCNNADYGTFRRAVILEQVSWLRRAYLDFVRDEYQELLSRDEQAQLAEQAKGE